MLEILGAAAMGALATLAVTWWLNRNSASRSARREAYLELLTMLKAALRVQQTATFDHDSRMPDVISDDRIDEFNARLELDVSPEVRELAADSFRLVQRFNAAHVMRVPVEVDDHGLYRYRFDQGRQQLDEDAAALHLRMSLGGIHDELEAKVDQLAARVRREVHGTPGLPVRFRRRS